MRIDSVSSQSFGALIYGNSINSDILSRKPSRALMLELGKITQKIKAENLDALKNVDIILAHDSSKGFYGIISSKEQGIPYAKDGKRIVSSIKDSIDGFKKWANEWNEAYSPAILDRLHKALGGFGIN